MNGLQKTSIIQTVTVMKNQEGLGHSQAKEENKGDKTKNCEGCLSVGQDLGTGAFVVKLA